METGPVCARCPQRLGRSCCEVEGDEQLATLTLADVERMSAHLRWKAERFSEDEWLSDEAARAYEQRRPLYAGYFRHGPRRLTLRRRQGACVFHRRDGGCSLPTQVRPSACRLYPFELWPSGQWSLQVDRHGSAEVAGKLAGHACLAVEESASMEEVLKAFGGTEADVEALGEQLSTEVRDHARRTSPAGGRLGNAG